jgi:hypothetical protein
MTELGRTTSTLHEFVEGGYLANLAIEKIFDDGLFARFDVKLALPESWEIQTAPRPTASVITG